MANERRSSGINVGGASIIMVFSILCLTIFSVLTLITANSENTLAQKSADEVSAYYAADSKSVDKLAQIKSVVANQSSLEGISSAASALKTATVINGNTLYISYSEKINKGQDLSVKLSTDGSKIKVIDWKVVNTSNWEPSSNIDFGKGNPLS